jgi:hypothetical protein
MSYTPKTIIRPKGINSHTADPQNHEMVEMIIMDMIENKINVLRIAIIFNNKVAHLLLEFKSQMFE